MSDLGFNGSGFRLPNYGGMPSFDLLPPVSASLVPDMGGSGIRLSGDPLSGVGKSAAFQPSWMQEMVGYKDPTSGAQFGGWGMPAVGLATAGLNAWMGMKQYGLAKNQLAEGKRQFALNYDAQRNTTNAQLEDRQRARVASNPGAYQSVGDYMKDYSIKGG